MKKVIKKLGLLVFFFLILCMVYFGVFFTLISPRYTTNYNAALLDKVHRLESIEEPKIILCGNSNLAFGIDSRLIEEEIGMPVVNMGLHGGLGNKFLERCALLNINPGDILIVCHTNYSDSGKLGQTDLTWITLENHKELWRIPDFQEWIELIPALPDYAFNALSLYFSGRGNLQEDVHYAREAFNEYGDNVSERYPGTMEIDIKKVVVPTISDQCMERLNNITKECREKGAQMLIAGYPILVGETGANKQAYIDFQGELEQRLECQVISDYTDYFYTTDLFYDDCLHMTNEGAEIRTRQLIKDIKKWMGK